MVNKRVDLSDAQITHLKSLVTGQVSTNENAPAFSAEIESLII